MELTVLQSMYLTRPDQKLVTKKRIQTPLLNEQYINTHNTIIQLYQSLYV